MTWYVEGDTPLHRLSPQAKLVSLVLFLVFLVSATRPMVLFWDGLLVVAVLGLSRLPVVLVLKRLVIELPFLVFALLSPFVASGPRLDFLGVSVSAAGLSGAAILLAKSTMGVLLAIVFASTTRAADLLIGLERLHLPKPFLAILSSMVRYLALVQDDLRRMLIAMRSRSSGRRSLATTGQVAGTLFVRSYERGERVHLAMQARGGSAVTLRPPTPVADWFWAAVLPVAAGAAVMAS